MRHNRLGFKHLAGLGALEGWRLRRKYFPQTVLDELAASIARSEQEHAGELMLAIEAAAPAHEPDTRLRALEVFGRLRVWDTPLNTGVLLYLALDRRHIELVADRGVGAPDAEWEAICGRLRSDLAQGRYLDGVKAAIEAIEQVCRQYCPPAAGEGNQLPDQPVLL